jgi:hypothetical protein
VRITPAGSTGSGSATGAGSGVELVAGIPLSNAIVAQQLAAYERYSSFLYGKPVVKYGGLTSAGEIIRVRTRQVPSAAWADRRKAMPLRHAALSGGVPASCSA